MKKIILFVFAGLLAASALAAAPAKNKVTAFAKKKADIMASCLKNAACKKRFLNQK